MTIKIKLIKSLDNAYLENQILNLLLSCNHEFLPTLTSKRKRNGYQTEEELLRIYLEEKKLHNHHLIAWKGNLVVGYLNFIHNDKEYNSNHIDTICVLKSYRKQGIANQLYAFMENDLPNGLFLPVIHVTTWSTNESQVSILKKRNYNLFKCIKNARGNGIDTLTFQKKLDFYPK